MVSDGEWKAFGANCWKKGKDAGMLKKKESEKEWKSYKLYFFFFGLSRI